MLLRATWPCAYLYHKTSLLPLFHLPHPSTELFHWEGVAGRLFTFALLFSLSLPPFFIYILYPIFSQSPCPSATFSPSSLVSRHWLLSSMPGIKVSHQNELRTISIPAITLIISANNRSNLLTTSRVPISSSAWPLCHKNLIFG